MARLKGGKVLIDLTSFNLEEVTTEGFSIDVSDKINTILSKGLSVLLRGVNEQIFCTDLVVTSCLDTEIAYQTIDNDGGDSIQIMLHLDVKTLDIIKI